MACELLECCQFFKDNMAEFPRTAQYIKDKLCFGRHEKCTRYRIYKGTAGGVFAYFPGDEDEVAKISRCLREKQGRGKERETGEQERLEVPSREPR